MIKRVAGIQTLSGTERLLRRGGGVPGVAGGGVELWVLVGAFAGTWMLVLKITFDGRMHGLAPGLGAIGADVFVLSDLDGLEKGLGEVSEGGGSLGFHLAPGGCGKEATKSGAEIAGGEITAREEIRDVAAELLGGFGLDFFVGVKIAEMRMA
jgi:hypothetical protein